MNEFQLIIESKNNIEISVYKYNSSPALICKLEIDNRFFANIIRVFDELNKTEVAFSNYFKIDE